MLDQVEGGVRGIVFDLDGTLIHSLPDIHAAANTVLTGRGITPLSESEARSFIGRGAPAFIDEMMAARALDPGQTPELLSEFMGLYEDAVNLTVLYPGVEDSLVALAEAGFTLGVCTNKPLGPTRAVLRHFALEGRFAAVFGGDSLPVRKPDPRPLRETYVAMAADPFLYIGDSEVDAATSEAAGVPFGLYTEGYRKMAAESLPQTFSFNDFRDLPDLVQAVARRAS